MKAIPNSILTEMTAICKVLAARPAHDSVKMANALRKASLLYKKLKKLNETK